MPEQNHDYVDFMAYNGEKDEQEKVCRVYLTKGKLFYEGSDAKKVKKMVDGHDLLAPYRKIGGYSLLAALPQVFNGSMFYATKVREPFQEADPK